MPTAERKPQSGRECLRSTRFVLDPRRTSPSLATESRCLTGGGWSLEAAETSRCYPSYTGTYAVDAVGLPEPGPEGGSLSAPKHGAVLRPMAQVCSKVAASSVNRGGFLSVRVRT